MLFTSPIFLFLFLPLVLGVSVVIPTRLRNLWLLLTSLLFYSWGEPSFVAIMLGSIAANFCFGLLVERTRRGRFARWAMALAVATNIGLLVAFKYANFLADNLNAVLPAVHLPVIQLARIALPLGISFFTFHALSYVIDVHRGVSRAQRNPIDFGLYIALFPQLIAGPIVRYHDIAAQLARRTVGREDFATGVQRFIVGLGKKMLIANVVAVPADAIFALPTEQLTAGLSWLGVVCYTVQIYFDFSGYSDMAIGLARMFGFRLLENFNYPYISQSLTEFWRRWHISLSNWFRDYLYIPLGGNRRGPVRTYFNLVTVFFLCGFWHGASWSFVVWGLFHGSFLVLERVGLSRWLESRSAAVRHLYLVLTVMVAWVFFRAATLSGALQFLRAMAGFGYGTGIEQHASLYVNPELELALAAGLIGSMPWLPALGRWEGRFAAPAALVRVTGLALVLFASVMSLSAETYNPFIYFRF